MTKTRNAENEFVIFSPWLAYELRKQGFKLLRQDINRNHPEYDCWIFENNTDLQIAISYLTRNRKKK